MKLLTLLNLFQHTLLRITANTVNEPLRVARLVEAVLEASFRDQVCFYSLMAKFGKTND